VIVSNGNTQRSSNLVERYVSGGPILNYALSGLTPVHEQARPGPGDWSLAELAAHLVDADLVFANRIKQVIAEPEPTLQAFDENAWIAKLGYQKTSVEESVTLLAANRRWMARILRDLSDADFARVGLHTERGRLTLAELLAYAVGHVDHHLRFVYAKRAKLGIALPPRYTSEATGI
jgi:uncharacterized damage-inducible protein DinB